MEINRQTIQRTKDFAIRYENNSHPAHLERLFNGNVKATIVWGPDYDIDDLNETINRNGSTTMFYQGCKPWGTARSREFERTIGTARRWADVK